MADGKPQYRLTIAGCLWAVAVASFWLASLRSASVAWTTLTATMTLTALLSSVLGSGLSRGRLRAFWLGFALFGWVYLAMVDWDWFGGQMGHDLTGGLSDWAEEVIPPVKVTMAPVPGPGGGPPLSYSESAARRAVQVGNFVQIGRMALSLLFALAGGLIGRTLYAGENEPPRGGPV